LQRGALGKIRITRGRLAIGGIVVVAIIAVLALVGSMSGGTGSISFSPSTVSCSSPVTITEIAHLPSSVHPGDTITEVWDGQTMGSGAIQNEGSGGSTIQQADGSWTMTATYDGSGIQTICSGDTSASGAAHFTIGTHTVQVLDSTGKVLAQGSYTVTH
jgi:hypothetical protein